MKKMSFLFTTVLMFTFFSGCMLADTLDVVIDDGRPPDIEFSVDASGFVNVNEKFEAKYTVKNVGDGPVTSFILQFKDGVELKSSFGKYVGVGPFFGGGALNSSSFGAFDSEGYSATSFSTPGVYRYVFEFYDCDVAESVLGYHESCVGPIDGSSYDKIKEAGVKPVSIEEIIVKVE